MGTHTIIVRTLDAGPVTMPEPAWCLGQHEHQNGGYRADIAHQGPETTVAFRGFEVLAAGLVAYPFAERRGPAPAVAVDMGADWLSLDADGLDTLASALVDHGARLRALARELSVLRATSGGGQ
ncbi:DUF6907 domain-containing protein [Streptomyces syringium]|uniref:DUF6907 domain-containing protein n=1 Tax=Streptomyces syringium TaxID=76729 RepID=UPI0036E02546